MTDLEKLWAACEVCWGEPGVHEQFLEGARREGRLAEAAARYKARADDPVAQARLAQVKKLAELSLIPSPRPPAPGGSRWTRLLVLLVAVAALVVAASWLARGR